MAWFKVDDGFYSSRKVTRIPRATRWSAVGLWTIAGAWCAKELTDGFIPLYQFEELGAKTRDADALVDAGLWYRENDGYRFHDWDSYQPTREQVMDSRKRDADRKRRPRGVQMESEWSPSGEDADSEHPDHSASDPAVPPPADAGVTPQRKPRGTRIPEPFIVTREMREWANGRVPGVNVDSSTEKFANYWRAKTRDATKLDWRGTWDNWLISDFDRLRPEKPTPMQRAKTTLSLATDIDTKELTA